MKITPQYGKLAAGIFALALTSNAWAQSDPVHAHLNVGATSTAQGSALIFANGANFVPGSGWTKPLTYIDNGVYAGYYQGGITLTALAGTAKNSETGVAAPQAAALGSFLRAGIVSVSGPAGGSFAFWDTGATQPTYSYTSGYSSLAPVDTWALSDAALGAGTIGADPFGHLHGRRFSATVPGDYLVTFQAIDTSVNGLGGGPIHTPSDLLTIGFSAVPEPSVYALTLLGLGGLVWAGWNRQKN
ncbi:MAG TPA: PEP-CTERM sorting domain-containing protein [Candidatus Limnocylindria bacterium]|jgi:hypothetical protein|nr:PEP-CTERM sorting domain-containing protein [Candidatus Limnocylindria bacterium]